MKVKYFILTFCGFTLVSCTSNLQSEETKEDISQSNAAKVTQTASEQDTKLKDAPAYYARALQKYEKLNDVKGAMVDLNQAISLNPQYTEAYYNRAILKDEMRDFQGALADFNQAIAFNPKYSEAYHYRANLKADKLKDQPGAINDYRLAARFYRESGQTQYLEITIASLKQLGATE
jgi:tetratricopeptide (TPR) repeat protein